MKNPKKTNKKRKILPRQGKMSMGVFMLASYVAFVQIILEFVALLATTAILGGIVYITKFEYLAEFIVFNQFFIWTGFFFRRAFEGDSNVGLRMLKLLPHFI